MVIYFYRDRADNENFALLDTVIAPDEPGSKRTFVEALEELKPVEPLLGDFAHALNHLNADEHYIAPVMPVAPPHLPPGLVPI
jgi:hypothetical protein